MTVEFGIVGVPATDGSRGRICHTRSQLYIRKSRKGNGKKKDMGANSNTRLQNFAKTTETQIRSVDIKMDAYPPYLVTSSPPGLLVKGSTCKLIMQLHEATVRTKKIPKHHETHAADLAKSLSRKAKTERYTPAEINLIIQTCKALRLDGLSPLATEAWENEPIEGWWYKEDSYCGSLSRQTPVSEEVAGYDCNDGWWRDKQNEKYRDWERWGESSIGPKHRRGGARRVTRTSRTR
ncbi:hypothetical protein EDD36DRAFT_462879 [Exophiala viscosa]|uniref:Uncharacterized protein n=1 Tax=Exophiala viscosa TaxID=2486360 RepID=A0AAN6E1T5_9EURO|nr:hypothetical protein EDD36DRAFT_462879 [Exophiala viscosa]